MEYTYLGDRSTDTHLKNRQCKAVRRPDGKYRRSRLSTMLVEFETGKKHIVLARQLRKIKIHN